MRDQPPRRWRQWRVKLNRHSASSVSMPFTGRPLLGVVESGRDQESDDRNGDGIRHELVARIRREIEAGTYDTEARWRLAEERLLQHLERMS